MAITVTNAVVQMRRHTTFAFSACKKVFSFSCKNPKILFRRAQSSCCNFLKPDRKNPELLLAFTIVNNLKEKRYKELSEFLTKSYASA